MVRDVKNVTETVRKIDTNSFGGSSNNSYTNILYKSARADPVSTFRYPGGIYSDPSSYWGYFYRGSGAPFAYTYYNGLPSPVTKVSSKGDSAFNLLSTINQGSHGVIPLTLLPSVNNWWSSTTSSKVQGLVKSSSWNLGQDMAEMGETLRFLATPIRLIFDLLKAIEGNPYALYNLMRTKIVTYETHIVRLGKYTGTVTTRAERGVMRHYLRTNKLSILKQSSKGAASAWLAYKFAWLPLMQSVHNALKYVQDGLTTQTLQASAHTEAGLDPPALRNGTVLVDSYWKGESGCKIEVSYRISSSVLNGLSRLGLTNPAMIVWESVPLSFVVDWFLPIGQFLQAVGGNVGVTFHQGYQTNYVKYQWNARYYPVVPGQSTFDGNFCRYQCGMFSFVRNVLIALPIPTPQFRGFGTKLSGDKILSMAAIAMQRL